MSSNRFDRITRVMAEDGSRRSLIWKAFGIGGSVALAKTGIALAQSGTPDASSQTEPTQFLFVMIGGTSTSDLDEDGLIRLTTEEMQEHSVLFGDRPSRLVGTVETDSVLDQLTDAGGGSNPMNAARGR